MQLFPAIDIYGGRAVRLLHGDYAQMTVYREHPEDAAREFVAAGAKNAHIVDLEGAKTGQTPNLAVIERIVKETALFVQVGGGIRSEETIGRYLDAGVGRTILGTVAVIDPDFLARMVARYGEKIAVSVDIRDGMVATHGWTRGSGMKCDDFMRTLQDVGVGTVVCTDISRDGAMRGTNRALYASLSQAFSMDFIASGGVSSMEDVIALRDMGLYGAIVGKAYYTGAIDLARAIEVSA